MLTIWRRHEKSCPHKSRGRRYTKCRCPIWCDGKVDGQPRIRQTLDTRDWQRAGRLLIELEQAISSGEQIRAQPVQSAVKSYLAAHKDELEVASFRKYQHRGDCLVEFCSAEQISGVDEITLAVLDRYRTYRKLSPLTWSKELQFLRSMMTWWQKRRWVISNPARDMRMPRQPAGGERIPYTDKEIAAIIAACESAGHHDYERLRWRAMLLLMRFYGLRVSDVATLERKRVNEQRIAVRAIKNKRWLWMPLYPEVGAALEAVPPPSGLENKYFFWSERGSRENHVNNTIMSLAAVYRASGVPAATSHRFRHTLAMELLAKGASVEQVADVLGDSPATVRKHYKHWMPEYQAATAELLDRVHRTAKQSR